jgi:hypothetical protein
VAAVVGHKIGRHKASHAANGTGDNMSRQKLLGQKFLEWAGVATAILYSMLIALNIGAEFIGFSLLLISAFLIGLWAYFGRHRGILFLQLFYATAGLIGMLRWF